VTKITTAMSIPECAEESVKETMRVYDDPCDVIIICVPIGKGMRILKQIQNALGFDVTD
jgi:prephenate dehydrogenase